MEPHIWEEVLRRTKAVADEAEVYAMTSVQTPVKFEANRLKQIETRETSGVALRLIVNGRIGFASTTNLDNLQVLVDNALAVASYGSEAKFTFPEVANHTPIPVYDPALATSSVEKMVEAGQWLIDRVRSYHSDILGYATLRKELSSVDIVNSRGGGAHYSRSALTVGVDANWVRGTDILDVWEEEESCRIGLNYQAIADRIVEKIRLAEETVPTPTGQLPVIFTPKGVVSALLAPLQMAFNGRNVLEGASPLRDKLNQRVFSPALTLYDDGRVADVPTSAPCDGEGVPTRCTPLIEQGVVRSFFYDLQTAGLAGAQSTGNGRRTLPIAPKPLPNAWIVSPGNVSYEDMLADVREGLLVDQVMGAWAGNVLSGDFSGNVHLGYRIQNGKLVGRVKDTMVAGNIFKALDDLAAIGDEAAWVGGVHVQTPHLYFRALGVASKS